MKTLRFKILPLLFLLSGGMAVFAQQNQPEVPGDNFSLEGALELFKKSSSPEEFERMLNAADSKVNNLDLNGDGVIDYIRVIDQNEGNVHAFILQAIISDSESQDIAVIELEKLANGKAVLQITGDEDVYGIETIIEPTEEVRINAGTTTTRTVVNVWAWPSVQYVYGPHYTLWVSPWHWHLRPVWWIGWRPVVYYEYYSWWQPYRPYYSRCHTHRIVYAQQLYRPHRRSSTVVYTRHQSQLTDYRSRHRDDHNRRDTYGDNRTGRGSYAYERKDRDGNSKQRTPVNRQWSPSGKKESSRSFTDAKSQHRDTPSFERRPSEKRGEPSFERKPDVKQKQNTSQRSFAPKQRSSNNDAMKRSHMTPGKSSQPREIRPAPKTGKSGSSGSPSFKRSDNSSSRKKKN